MFYDLKKASELFLKYKVDLDFFSIFEYYMISYPSIQTYCILENLFNILCRRIKTLCFFIESYFNFALDLKFGIQRCNEYLNDIIRSFTKITNLSIINYPPIVYFYLNDFYLRILRGDFFSIKYFLI